METDIVRRVADNIRVLTIGMVEKAKSGHPGGAMGAADFISVLFSEFLNFDTENPEWPFRDRFVLDPGHMSPMLYSMLSIFGNYSIDDLKKFRQWGSVTPGHPELDPKRGVETTTGPLGQGHAMAMGMAIAERHLAANYGEWTSHKVYCLASDGTLQEEIASGVGRLAGHLGLSNFIMFYDSNRIQLSHKTSVANSEDTTMKYESWGWSVEEIDGNSHQEIFDALERANRPENKKPTLIIGKTVMGKGLVDGNGDRFESKVALHGQPVSSAGGDVDKSIKSLGGDPDDPFAFFKETDAFREGVARRCKTMRAGFDKREKEWKEANPEKYEELQTILNGDLPEIDYSAIELKENTSTRNTSSQVLSLYAERINNMIVASADLSNSDKTIGFLKKTRAISKDDYAGKFFQPGVSELTMAATANGMALHYINAVCATFFVFSDYMKPAIRLAALMELPVKYLWTHDAFRVGEDGPTHQPVEHEAQIRLFESMENNSGRQSALVLRPADAAESVIAWKTALENKYTPTCLIFTRQNVQDIKSGDKSRLIEKAEGAAKGGYTVYESGDKEKPDLILVANGSEVELLIRTAERIEAGDRDISIRVISMISSGLFLNQPKEYRESLIPKGVPVFAATPGIPNVFCNIVGSLGKVYSLGKFGKSAPFEVLNTKFGFTVDNMEQEIYKYLEEYGNEVGLLCSNINLRPK